MTTHELIIQLSGSVYRRLEHIAQETNQSVQTIALTLIAGNLPPSLGDVPADLREELRALQTLDDDALWAAARSKLGPTQQARLETLLARLGDEIDRLNLRKAQAFALLRWRGFLLPSLDDQAQQI